MNEELFQLLSNAAETVVLISFSAPLDAGARIERVRIRPVRLKGKLLFQVEEFTATQSFTKNSLTLELEGYMHQFSQALFRFQEKEFHLKDGKITTKTIKAKTDLEHNRKKGYLLRDDEPIDFLIHLGIQNKSGRVLREKHDKFKQINQFVQLLKPIFDQYQRGEKVILVDLACGKAYLTFALYYYLTRILSLEVKLYGVDVKQDVLQKCQKLADDLRYSGMHFVATTIDAFERSQKPVDLVVALHACDTATDMAIQKALSLQAKAIACAPCCQHELAKQMKKDTLLLKHGLLRERFAALVTDALRAEFLEQKGYKVDLIEFVDPEHTPKNLLIRAVKRMHPKKEDFSSIVAFQNELGVRHTLCNFQT